MQRVKFVMVNLISPLHKENDIGKKNVHSKTFLVFLLTLEVPVSSRSQAIVCMHA